MAAGLAGSHPFRCRALDRGLEQFRLRCSNEIAAVSHVISTLGGREEAERRGDERVDLIEAAGPRGPQEPFQFCERLLDRLTRGESATPTYYGCSHRTPPLRRLRNSQLAFNPLLRIPIVDQLQ